jgi:hypothetical protein
MIRLLLFSTFLSLSLLGLASNDKSFDVEKWEDAVGDKNYDNFESEKLKKEKDAPDFSNLPTKGLLNSLSVLKQIIIVAVIGGIIVLFIMVLVKNQKGVNYNKKINTKLDVEIEQIEADLLNMDMPRLIEKAFQDKDYRRELRLYYLWSIQLLDVRNHLTWKKEKTNSAYVKELLGNNFHVEFQGLTDQINIITYGEISVDASLYGRLKSKLVSITTKLNE